MHSTPDGQIVFGRFQRATNKTYRLFVGSSFDLSNIIGPQHKQQEAITTFASKPNKQTTKTIPENCVFLETTVKSTCSFHVAHMYVPGHMSGS